MNKLKKIIPLILAIALVAGVSINATTAYLKDEDHDVNVMTIGSVRIRQIEQQLAEDGTTLEDFRQAKDLYPGCEVSKIVSVKNIGKSDAYFRTLIAFESVDSDTFGISFPIDDLGPYSWSWGMPEAVIEVDGVTYEVYEALYKNVLTPNETSTASLTKVELAATATNEDMEQLGKTYDILVLSQAVQVEGFADAKTALETAFGKTSEKAAEWFGGTEVPVLVATAGELTDALEAGKSVVLTNDIALTEAAFSVDSYAGIDLNGNTLKTVGLDLKAGGKIVDGTIASAANTNLTPHLKVSGGTLTMENVTVNVQHTLNANRNWTEATGMEIMNAAAILNDCHVRIHNGVTAQWVYSYGISLNNADITVNGGSITATCAAGTAANGPTNPNAISAMGECAATLNDVSVTAAYYATTVNGHLTINTTDKNVTSDDVVDNRNGSHTLNYIG